MTQLCDQHAFGLNIEDFEYLFVLNSYQYWFKNSTSISYPSLQMVTKSLNFMKTMSHQLPNKGIFNFEQFCTDYLSGKRKLKI